VRKFLHIVLHKVDLGVVIFLDAIESISVLVADLVHVGIYQSYVPFVFIFSLSGS